MFGVMITFTGLMEIFGNNYGVIKFSKESMILRLFLGYRVKRVCILKMLCIHGHSSYNKIPMASKFKTVS